MGCCLNLYLENHSYYNDLQMVQYVGTTCENVVFSCEGTAYNLYKGPLYVPKMYNGKKVVALPVSLKNESAITSQFISIDDVTDGILFSDEYNALPDNEKDNYYVMERVVVDDEESNINPISGLCRGGSFPNVSLVNGEYVVDKYEEEVVMRYSYKGELPIITNTRGDNDIFTTNTQQGNEIYIQTVGNTKRHWWLHDGENGHSDKHNISRLFVYIKFWISTWYDDNEHTKKFHIRVAVPKKLIRGADVDNEEFFDYYEYDATSGELQGDNFSPISDYYTGWVSFCQYVRVISLYEKVHTVEKIYNGYSFICDNDGYFDSANGFPHRVEVYDEDDVFRGYSYHSRYVWGKHTYSYISGGSDGSMTEIYTGYIPAGDCTDIGKDVGIYKFDFVCVYNPKNDENAQYWSDVDLDNVKIKLRVIRPYEAEIKPRPIEFNITCYQIQDKIYDCLPIPYSKEATVTVGGMGFVSYKNKNGDTVYEGADYDVTIRELTPFSKNVNEYGYTLIATINEIIPWTPSVLYPERAETKLSNYEYSNELISDDSHAEIIPATISPSKPLDVTRTYDCVEETLLIANDFNLTGIMYCDEGKVGISVTKRKSASVIKDADTYTVTYYYTLTGIESGNYVLDRESDTVTITINKRPLHYLTITPFAIDYEEKEYDGEELHVTEPELEVRNLASCDVGKVWLDIKVTYNPNPFIKDVGTYKATAEYILKADGVNLNNYDYINPEAETVRGRIVARTLYLSKLDDITKVYDCKGVDLPSEPNMLNKVAGDDLYLIVTRSSDGSNIIDVQTRNVSYSYRLGGIDAKNYILDADSKSDVIIVTVEKRCPGIVVTQELEIDYEEKDYDGEELHVTEPVVVLTSLASCDTGKIWIEPVVTYTPRQFVKNVGTYKAEVHYYIRYNGAKTSNYKWEGDEECDGLPTTTFVQGVIKPLKLEDFDCPSCITSDNEENEDDENDECIWARKTYDGSVLYYNVTTPEFGFVDGDEVTVNVSVSGSITSVYDSNRKLIGVNTSGTDVKTYPITVTYLITGKDASNYELPENMSCSGVLEIKCIELDTPRITGEYSDENITLSHEDLVGVINDDKTKVALLLNYQTETETDTTITIIVTPTLTGAKAKNYCYQSQTIRITLSKSGGQGGGGGGQGGGHGTQTQTKHETPIIAVLGDGAKWEDGVLQSSYNPDTHILTVRVYIPLEYYQKYLVASYPSYIRVLVSSNGAIWSYRTNIPRFSFNGSTYDGTAIDSYVQDKGVFQTRHEWDRKIENDMMYWEFEFEVDNTGNHNFTYVTERNKLLSNTDYYVYAWAFGDGAETSDIASEVFLMTEQETSPPDKGDISVFLVDTPTTIQNMNEWGSYWEDEYTPHTLINAIRFAKDEATILFSGSLMNNQQEKPIVSSEVEYLLDFAVTIDASKPYKVIKNENNEYEIVVDESITNWNGVIIDDCIDRMMEVRTITKNPVTLKNIHFRNGISSITAYTPVYMYDCIIENFTSYAVSVQSDFKVSRCIFKNCKNATSLRGDGIIDDCLFENNYRVFPTKNHKSFIYNCTIVAPTTIQENSTTGLTHLDYYNCFISGYPLKYSATETTDETYKFYDRVARYNIILHTNAKPSLDSPILNEDNEDVTENYIRTYNEVYGENNVFNNEVYELSGINDNPTTSDFLYKSYRPRSKGDYVVVDKGNNEYIQSETDLLGNPRVYQNEEDGQGKVDIGCYEYIPYSVLPELCVETNKELTYDGQYHNLCDIYTCGEEQEFINIKSITICVLSDEYNLEEDTFDWDNVDSVDEIIEHYESFISETYTQIPSIKHATVTENEEYIWTIGKNILVIPNNYKCWCGKISITINQKPLELFNFTVNISDNRPNNGD